jgi:hypothetical protein
MQQVNFRITDEEHAIIARVVDYLNEHENPTGAPITIPSLAKRLLLADTGNIENHPMEGVEVGEGKKLPFKIYLKEHERELIKRNAEAHGWSQSREAVFRLLSTLLQDQGEVCLYPEEIHALRQSKSAIDVVGRNIQHIIRGGRYVTINDETFRSEVRELLALIEEQKSTINNLLTAITNRWDV